MTPAEILRAAKAKIADPARWCQGEEARNEDREGTFAGAEDACQWCALGATGAVVPRTLVIMCDADILLNRAAVAMGYLETDELPPAAHLNDTTDHETVMALYDRAIELAEAEAS